MIGGVSVELRGTLPLKDQLRLLTLTPNDRRAILAKMGRAIMKDLKKQIRRTVRESKAHFPSASDRSEMARFFSRTVGMRATSEQVVIYDKGLERNRKQGDEATEGQARRMRALGFKMPVRVIQARFSQGLAGLIIREMEEDTRATRKAAGLSPRKAARKKRGSLVLMVWRKSQGRIMEAADIDGVIRRKLMEGF